MRITINGSALSKQPGDISNQLRSKASGKMKGTHAEARAFNCFLDALKNKVQATKRELLQDRKIITYEALKDKWFGVNEKTYMLLEVFRQHNEQMKELIGKDFSPATYQRYQTSKLHTQSFIKGKYKVDDIDIKKLNYEFINDYAFWLKSKTQLQSQQLNEVPGKL